MKPSKTLMRIGSLLLVLSLAFVCHADDVTSFYELTLNGQKVIVAGGTATNTIIDGKEMRITVRGAEWKKFDDGGVAFNFPASHGVAKDEKDAFILWTLDGQENIIMIYRLKDLDATEFLNNVVQELGKKYGRSSRTTDCECAFGGKAVKGKRITAQLAGETISQELYSLHARNGDYVFLIQNSGGTESSETRQVKDKLKETFSTSPAAAPPALRKP